MRWKPGALLQKTHSNVEDVHSDTTHFLFGADTLLGSPLEGGNTGILDLVQVLHTLGDVDHQVGTGRIGTKTPDLPSISDIPPELVSHDPSTRLEIVAGADLAALDSEGELLLDGLGLEIQAVVLVLGLGQGNDG